MNTDPQPGPGQDPTPEPARPGEPAAAPAPSAGPSGFGRFLVLMLLLFAIGGFGLATLCGAVFTIAGFGNSGGSYIDGVWVIALPSLLIGGWLTWLCTRQFLRFLRARP